MNELYYIGLDVHKKSITYTIKTQDGARIDQARLPAQRAALQQWADGLERPFVAALEATMFSGWVWDELQPYARELQLAHPQQLEAITKAKKKNDDRLDSDKICDLLRCDLLPGCYMMPSELRELRRVLRYRNLPLDFYLSWMSPRVTALRRGSAARIDRADPSRGVGL